MGLLEQREGANRLKVLSYIAAEEAEGGAVPHTDIVDGTALSGGSVSRHCNALQERDKGVLERTDNGYRVNREELMRHYWSHLENRMVRRDVSQPYADEITFSNEVATQTKMEAEEFQNTAAWRVIEDVLMASLIDVPNDKTVSTMRELFLRVDERIRMLATNYVEDDSTVYADLAQIALAIDDTYTILADTDRDRMDHIIVGRMADQLRAMNNGS